MKKTLNEIMIIALFTAFMGQVHFYPFGTDFRITIGVVMFTFLLLYFYSVPIIMASVVSGLSVLIIRTGIDAGTGLLSLDAAFYKHFPAFMYYLSYGLILDQLKFRRSTEKPVYFILIASSADIFSNFFELIIRNQFGAKPFDAIFSTFLLTAFLRSVAVLSMFWIIKYYNMAINKEEHQKRYQELLVLTAKLKSEIFFLSKSSQDIENAMAKSYSIYHMIKEREELGKDITDQVVSECLTLSIDIHEIKKDYNRVVMSMEKLLPTKHEYEAMALSEIFDIINDIFTRYLEATSRDISLTFELEQDFKTDKYLILISILNNLIQNSIEASRESGAFIKVKSSVKDGGIFFKVQDNGKGIQLKDTELVFEPGYTTKYNPETGQVSTGLGLTHIKILSEYLQGRIALNNTVPEATEFILEFPSDSIVYKEDENG